MSSLVGRENILKQCVGKTIRDVGFNFADEISIEFTDGSILALVADLAYLPRHEIIVSLSLRKNKNESSQISEGSD